MSRQSEKTAIKVEKTKAIREKNPSRGGGNDTI